MPGPGEKPFQIIDAACVYLRFSEGPQIPFTWCPGCNFTQWLSWTAAAFVRRRHSGFADDNEYRRGVTQLLLLITPDAGETTRLEMLPHQLDDWLQKGDGPCLHELQSAIYGWTSHVGAVDLSKVLLAALKRATGRNGAYHTFLPLRVQDSPLAQVERGMTVHAASAVRLLYAAIQPLQRDSDAQSYENFFMELDARVKEQLNISILIDFLRLALEVPDHENVLLIPMIDGAQHAKGRFGREKREKVTWHLQIMEEIVMWMNALDSTKPTLILPVTAAIKGVADNMTSIKLLSSSRSLAAQLGADCCCPDRLGRFYFIQQRPCSLGKLPVVAE